MPDRKTVGVAFDVDGVLLRGPKALKGAKEALQELDRNHIPWILLTNGGGYLEADKAKQIGQILDYPVNSEQLLIAHTPFRMLAKLFHDKPVLVVGKSQVHKIARSYGFKNTYDISDLHHQWPTLFPDWKPVPKESEFDFSFETSHHHQACPSSRRLEQPLACVLSFMDPLYYHRDMQIVLDVLRSPDGWPVPTSSTAKAQVLPQLTPADPLAQTLTATLSSAGFTAKQAQATLEKKAIKSNGNEALVGGQLGLTLNRPEGGIPAFFAGPDLEYVTDHPLPRLGAGIFGDCVGYLFERTTGRQLTREICGKPYPITYKYAQDFLAKRAVALGYSGGLETVIAIGDNPASDIRGANQAGWISILVRTGMFQGTVNDPNDPADMIVDDVHQAVRAILQGLPNGISKSKQFRGSPIMKTPSRPALSSHTHEEGLSQAQQP